MTAIKFKLLAGLLLFGVGVGAVAASGIGVGPQAGDANPPAEKGIAAPGKGPNLHRLASPVDGIVLFVGTPGEPAGPAVAGEQKVEVKVGGKSIAWNYRRLKEGDLVDRGQILVQLDPRLALNDRLYKKAKVAAAQADHAAATATAKEAQARLDRLERLTQAGGNRGLVSEEDHSAAVLARNKYAQEEISKREAVNMAVLESARAEMLLEMHQIRSPVRGIVRAIHKNSGEGVRALDATLIEIEEIKRK
jgi:multidrug efflux pump subunit AcrA (membrane-fusion protein)